MLAEIMMVLDEPYPACRKVCLDTFGEHVGHCKELHEFKYMHDLVRDVLCDGGHVCEDFTGVPLWARDNRFVVGQKTLKAESNKVAKYEKACLENQHVFIFFLYIWFPSPGGRRIPEHGLWVVHSNFLTRKIHSFVFSIIGFAIQNGVAAQLIFRLPVILFIVWVIWLRTKLFK
ncbi:hypothetical protein Hanom_Chr08g00751751 [Helianthus anomalus]